MSQTTLCLHGEQREVESKFAPYLSHVQGKIFRAEEIRVATYEKILHFLSYYRELSPKDLNRIKNPQTLWKKEHHLQKWLQEYFDLPLPEVLEIINAAEKLGVSDLYELSLSYLAFVLNQCQIPEIVKKLQLGAPEVDAVSQFFQKK